MREVKPPPQETGDLFGAAAPELGPPRGKSVLETAAEPLAAIERATTPAALVSAALREAAARVTPAPIDIGNADPPDGCYEITSLVDPRRRYMSQHGGQVYIGRAVFP